jgi:hypothetical protein
MIHDPQPITDVFGYLMGDGVAIFGDPAGYEGRVADKTRDISGMTQPVQPPREVWLGIEDDVAELERLLG